ncbi:MAG: nucleotidyltransferase domain-containing protein [Nitrolancea sp.]
MAQTTILTLEDLRARREEILEIARSHGARNVRIFGSVATNNAQPQSDIDFLVEMDPDRGVLDISELILALQEALGRDVDVVEIRRRSATGDAIQRQAVPL